MTAAPSHDTVTAPVTVVAPVPEGRPAQVGDVNIAPTTTAAEDLRTARQQTVHLWWESTQSIIAMLVTGAMIVAALTGKETKSLENAFTLIIAIYFVRMNHVKTSDPQKGDTGR